MYMKQIQKMAATDERIIMTDFVQGRILEELYSNAYLFILPSDVEGMALTLLEAMSYGNCCLVSDIPENIEVVENQAVTFKKGNVADLKEKLVFLLSNPEITENYGKKSIDYICGKYSWEKMVEQTKVIYENINRK